MCRARMESLTGIATVTNERQVFVLWSLKAIHYSFFIELCEVYNLKTSGVFLSLSLQSSEDSCESEIKVFSVWELER